MKRYALLATFFILIAATCCHPALASDCGCGASSGGGDDDSGSGDGSMYEAMALAIEAGELCNDGMLNESLQAYNQSLEKDSFSKSAWMGKGEVLFRLQRYDEAILAYEKVVKLDPSEADGYFRIGNSYLIAGEYTLAIESYEKALAVNPNLHGAEENLEAARAQLEEPPEPAVNMSEETPAVPTTAISPGVPDTQRTTAAAATPAKSPFLEPVLYAALFLAFCLIVMRGGGRGK